jgi:hypothetical protein
MAHQRKVFVIEIKRPYGRKWFEMECHCSLKIAKSEAKHWKQSNPDSSIRVVTYYPRDDGCFYMIAQPTIL